MDRGAETLNEIPLKVNAHHFDERGGRHKEIQTVTRKICSPLK